MGFNLGTRHLNFSAIYKYLPACYMRNSCYSHYTQWQLELLSLQVSMLGWAELPAWLHCLYGLNLHRPSRELRHLPHETPTWRQLNMGIPSLTGYCLWRCREEMLGKSEDAQFYSWAGLHSETPQQWPQQGGTAAPKLLLRTSVLEVKEKMGNIGNITYTWNVSSLQEHSDKPNLLLVTPDGHTLTVNSKFMTISPLMKLRAL